MANGTKRSGSPLEGGSTKFFITGPANNRVPAPRVAHLQDERTDVTEAPDLLRGAGTPIEVASTSITSPGAPASFGESEAPIQRVIAELIGGRISPSTAPSFIRKENSMLERSPIVQMLTESTEKDVGKDVFPGTHTGTKDVEEAAYGGNEQDLASPPSSALSYVTENGAATHSAHVNTAGSRKGPPVNGPPISRHPTVISITSSKHSKHQRSPPPRDPSVHVEENGRSDSDVQRSSAFTKLVDQRVLHNPLPSSDEDARESMTGKRTRGVFVIGCAAPVKIDEEIEVYLRSGANGEVDFVI